MCRQILDFIVGSFRLIMFLGTPLLLIAGIGLAMYGYLSSNVFYMVEDLDWASKATYAIYAGIYIVILAVVGALGAFYDQKETIRCFALLTVINVLIAAIFLGTLPAPEERDNQFRMTLKAAENDYDFKDKYTFETQSENSTKTRRAANEPPSAMANQQNSTTFKIKNATATWDVLQSNFQCCGVESRDEWINATGNYLKHYPKSCCNRQYVITDSQQYCSKENAYLMSCLNPMQGPSSMLIVVLIFAGTINLILAMVSIIASMKLDQYRGVSSAEPSYS